MVSPLIPTAAFPARLGFEDYKEHLKPSKKVRLSAVNKRDYTGLRSGVQAKIRHDNDGNLRLNIDRWAQDKDHVNQYERALTVEFEKVEIDGRSFEKIKSVKIFNQSFDVEGEELPRAIEGLQPAIKAILETIGIEKEKPDIEAIFKNFGLNFGTKNRLFRETPDNPKAGKAQDGVFFPRAFIHSLIGLELHKNQGNLKDANFENVTDPETGDVYDIFYEYERKKGNSNNVRNACYMQKHGDKSGPTRLYEVQFSSDNPSSYMSRLQKLEILGQEVDVTDYEVLARGLETIRKHNEAIQQHNYSVGNGKLFSDIVNQTRIIPFLYQRQDYPSFKDGGVSEFRILGGENQNTATVAPDRERSIGANSASVTQKGVDDKGDYRSFTVIVDDGIGFLNKKEHGFHYFRPSLNKFLRHRSDKKGYKPETETLAVFFTHAHKDHFDLDHDYDMPVMIMDPLTAAIARDEIAERRDISQSHKDDLLNKIYEIDPIKHVDPDNPDKVVSQKIGDTVVERWTEVFPDDSKPGGVDYAPRLKIYHKDTPEAAFEKRVDYVTHSFPNLMVDVITQSNHVYGITGDFKMGRDVYVGGPTRPAWINAVERDVLLMETTGADRPGRTPEYFELEDNLTQLYYEEAKKGQALKIPAMPRDVNTLFAITTALKRARKMLLNENPDAPQLEYFTSDGATLEQQISRLNKLMDFKEYMAREDHRHAPVISQGRNSAAIRERARTGDNSLAMTVTGTQGEPMAVMTRAANDELDRWRLRDTDTVIYAKSAIPVGKNPEARRQIKSNVETLFGSTVHLPEDYIKENDGVFIAASGHPGQDEIAEMVQLANAKYIIPTHGDESKYDKADEIIEASGSVSKRWTAQDVIGGERGQTVQWLRQEEEFRILGREIYPGDFFWRKRYTEQPEIPMPFILTGPVGDVANAVEEATRKSREASKGHRRRFSPGNDNTYPWHEQDIPKIGVEKFDSGFYKRRNISSIASADTEGSGLVHEQARLRSFGMHVRDIESRKQTGKALHYMATPKHVVYSLYAALKTYTHPRDLHKGDKPWVFAHKMRESLLGLTKEKGEASLLIGYNFSRYDRQMIRNELGLNGFRDLRPHQNARTILFDVRHLARAAYAFSKDVLNVEQKGDFLDFTLEGLSKANGIEYKDLHHALSDTYPAYAVYELIETKLKEAGREDILEQMLINADTRDHDMIKDIVGKGLRPGAPKPPFSYVSSLASRPEPRVGVVVGTELEATDGNVIIVQNLNYDPDDYMGLSKDEIYKMAQDPNCDVYEMINVDQHPIIGPMSFAYRDGASRKHVPESQALAKERARRISVNASEAIMHNSRARNAGDHDAIMKPYETRVIEAFTRKLKGEFGRRARVESAYFGISDKIKRIPRLKSEWGLIRTASEDMKNYFIEPTQDEIDGKVDLKHIANMAILLGRLNNDDVVQVVEENLYDRWQELDEKQQKQVSRRIYDHLRGTSGLSLDERKQEKAKIMSNIDIAIDNVQRRRALSVNGPADASHITLAKAEAQYREIAENKELQDEFIGGDKKRQAIFNAWPRYIERLRKDPDLANPYAKPDRDDRQRRIPERHLRRDRTASAPTISSG